MAVVNRDKGASNRMDEKTGQIQDDRRGKVVDIFAANASLPTGQKKKLDSKQADEAWSFNVPPPMGYYDMKPMPAKDTIRWNEEYEYYSANLECRLVSDDKDIDNIPVFATVTTRVGRGKNISTMGALIVKLGFKLPEEINDLELCKLLMMALKKEKILRKNFIDWRAGYKQQPSGDWKNMFSTMTQFPKNEDGTYRHRLNVTVGQGMTEEVSAQLTVVEWGDANEQKAKELASKSGKGKEGAATSSGGGIQLSKAATVGNGQEALTLESEGESSQATSGEEGVSEEDLKLAEAD